jgi:hypothetical protein
MPTNFVLPTVWKYKNGSNVLIKDMTDEEIVHAMDVLTSLARTEGWKPIMINMFNALVEEQNKRKGKK